MNPLDFLLKGASNIVKTGNVANSTSATAFKTDPVSNLINPPKPPAPAPSTWTDKTPEQQVADINTGIKNGAYKNIQQPKIVSNPIPSFFNSTIKPATGKEKLPTKLDSFLGDLQGNVKKIISGNEFDRIDSQNVEQQTGVSPNFFRDIYNHGAISVISGTLATTDSERAKNRYQALLDSGVDSLRARDIAIADTFKNRTNGAGTTPTNNYPTYDSLKVTPEEEKAMRWTKLGELANVALDVLGNGGGHAVLGSVKNIIGKDIVGAIARSASKDEIASHLLEVGMPEHVANKVAPNFVGITNEDQVAKKIQDISAQYKADPKSFGPKKVQTYPTLVQDIANESDPAKIKTMLESTGVDPSQHDSMAKILSTTDNPKRVNNIIEGFTKTPEIKQPKPEKVVKKYKTTVNIQDKEDLDYLKRILSGDQIKDIQSGKMVNFRGTPYEDLAKVNIINETPQTLAQKLEGKVSPFELKDRTLYHGTSANNTDTILNEGFKKGSELPNDAFRSGGYGQIQDSISFSTDPKIASNFTGQENKGVLFKTKLKDNAKIVQVKGMNYAEDLNDFIPELKKQKVDAVYLPDEKEIVVINKKSLEKIQDHTVFTVKGKPELQNLIGKKITPKPEISLPPEKQKIVSQLEKKIEILDHEDFQRTFAYEQTKEHLANLEEKFSNVDIKGFKTLERQGKDFGSNTTKAGKNKFKTVKKQLEDLGVESGSARDGGKTTDEVAQEVRSFLNAKDNFKQEERIFKAQEKALRDEKLKLKKQVVEVQKQHEIEVKSQEQQDKFLTQQADKNAKMIEEEKIAKEKASQRALKVEEIKKQMEDTQKRLLDEKIYKEKHKNLVREANRPDIASSSLGKKIKEVVNKSLYPIRNMDNTTKNIFREWKNNLLVTKELANEEFLKLSIPKEQGMKIINDFQAGIKNEYTDQIKSMFDKLFAEAKAKGFEFNYRENYLPQVYKETPEEIRQAIENHLAEKGLGEQLIQDYLDGVKSLPEDTARTLKLNPSFEKERTFPTYKVAEEYGLHPKYENPAQLAGYYKEQMEIATANKNFIKSLVDEGKVLKESEAPRSWDEIKLKVDGDRYFAKPEFATIINNQLKNDSLDGIGSAIVEKVANTSKFMQEMALSAGLPKSSLNFFTFGQAIKALTAGDAKMAGKVLFRSNFNPASIKFFTENASTIKQMASEGIDLSGRLGTYKNMYETLGDKLGRKEFKGVLGETFNSLFNEKTFASFMPQMQVENFKQVFQKGLAQGMTETEAKKFAGDVTKKFFGLLEDEGRSKATQSGLTALFFAPRFREGMIGVLLNNLKSVTTELRNPIFYKNRRLVLGMALTYGLYNELNKKLNGNYMWENEPGKEFDLKIPYGNGKFMYFSFMPSFLSFARSLISGTYNLALGNTKVATQKLGSVFSMPLKTATEITTNSDYFGRPIYKETDTEADKIKKVIGYTGNSFNHQYIKEIIRQSNPDNKVPLLQSISNALELPFKFSTQSQIDTANYYDNLNKFNLENTRLKEQNQKALQPTFDKVLELNRSGKVDEAQKIVDGLDDNQYEVYKTMLKAYNAKKTGQNKVSMMGTYTKIKNLVAQGKSKEAMDIVDGLSESDYKAYLAIKNQFTTKPRISPSGE